MAGQNKTNYDAMLKDFYLGPAREILDRSVRTRKMFEKSMLKFSGRQIITPVNISRNRGKGAIAESGALPAAGRQGYVQMKVPSRINVGRIELTGAAMSASRDDKGAFAQALSSEMELAVRDLAKDLNRQGYGDGTGTVAKTLVNAADTTLLLQRSDGVTGTNPNLGEPGVRYLAVGDKLVIDPAGTNNGPQLVTVSAIVDNETATVTPATVVTGDGELVVFARTVSDTSHNLEEEGLMSGVSDTGTYFGIARGSQPNWKSTIIDGSGGLDGDLLQQAVDAADERTGGVINIMLAHPTVRREYLKKLVALKQFSGGGMDMNLGMKSDIAGFGSGLDFNDFKLEYDVDCRYNTIFALDTSRWKVYEEKPLEWADDDGNILKWVTGFDMYEGYLRLFGNSGTDNPSANVRIDDIAATAPLLTSM